MKLSTIVTVGRGVSVSVDRACIFRSIATDLSSDVAFPEKYFPEIFRKNRKNMFDSKILISLLSSTANSRYFVFCSYNIQY